MTDYKPGTFGTPIPRLSDCVGIRGDNLVDKNGREFDKDTVKFNTKMGGNLEIISIRGANTKPKRKNR